MRSTLPFDYFASPRQPGGLSVDVNNLLLESASDIQSRSLNVDLEVAPEAKNLPSMPAAMGPLKNLLQQAIERSPKGGDISIVILNTSRGIEMEVADSGPDPELPVRLAAFGSPRLNGLAVADPQTGGSRCNYYCSRCPQGGLAWTVVLPEEQSARQVA